MNMELKKKMAAIGIATMMSFSTIGASADSLEEKMIYVPESGTYFSDEMMAVPYASNTFSLYISNSGAVVNQNGLYAGVTNSSGKVTVNVHINSMASDCSVYYEIYVDNKFYGSSTAGFVGDNETTIENSSIPKGKEITVNVRLNPKPSGVGSSASGYLTGK